jgi:asparagine synthase (glutamine-hydrolysing)
MCGISGIVDTNEVDANSAKSMVNCIHHRGPDDKGFYSDENIAFGHARLSIIDLELGNQPMETNSGIVLIYNGEVYNFLELRASLKKQGIQFETNSDTEVVLKLYESEGVKSFSKLNGMFAFAIWDGRKKELYLVRDRTGIKPLYYAKVGTKLVFGSEVKAILTSGHGPQRRLNKHSFHSFFNLRYVHGNGTMFEGIDSLPQASYLIWKNGEINIEKYWTPDFNNKFSDIKDSAKILYNLLDKAVERHLISDVEIGSYLSGGIDSSTIIAFTSKKVENLKTFTLGFDQLSDELNKARMTAEFFGTDHYERIIPSNFLDDAPKILWYSEFPKRNLYPYYLSEIAKPYVKVVLSGLGSDELFAGYTWKYDMMKNNQQFLTQHKDNVGFIKNSARILLEIQSKGGLIEHDDQLDYLETMSYIDEPHELYTQKISLDEVFNRYRRDRWYGSELKKQNFDDISAEFKQYFDLTKNDALRGIQYADFHSKLTNDFLHIDDRTSMAHSIESRVPFLDNTLIDFAFSTPVNMHYSTYGKDVLRYAMKDHLPKWVLEAPKQGFTISLSKEYTDNIIDYGKLLLLNGHTVKNNLISKEYIESIINFPARDKLTKHYYTLWNLLFFEIWYEIFIERELTKRPQFKITELIH